ncbi:MAG: AAA family ATPase [Peptoniphilus sp.]|nr:AAA family ATPase [Peptoniphilus sp.]MDD7363096.1 AAA family ATPase [Bacillota bacterium]MDY6044382.1 AAA family ATPase [Peptoniphilus sp.]
MIHKLELINFGAFHDTHVTFEEGYQCLRGPNESGKSTTVMCIRALLYGFSRDSLNRKLYSRAYDDYFPLNGGDFSAAMEVETSKGMYRIERNFRKENEQLTVIDLDANRIVEDETLYTFSGIAQPGSLFWGLSQDDFLRFFCMSDLQSIDALSILKRIEKSKNYLMRGHSDLRFQDAYDYLEKERKKIGTTRAKKSPLGRGEENIADLEGRIAEARGQLRRLKKNTDAKQDIAGDLRELKRRQTLQMEKTHLLPELHARIEEVDHIDRALDENEEAIDRFESKKQKGFTASKGTHKVTALIASLFAVFTAFLIAASNTEFAMISALATFVFIVISVVFFISSLRTKRAMRQYHQRYTERDELLARKHALYRWFDPYIDEDFDMSQLQNMMRRHATVLTQLPEETDSLDDAVERAQRRLGFIDGEEREVRRLTATLDELESAYAKEKAKKEELNRERQVIDMTESILREVDAVGRDDFQREILSDAEAYLSSLSGGRYDWIALADDYLSIIGPGRPSLKDTQLSQSTADLLVLSLRLAVVERMDPSIPMIFDDGFAFMDGDRRSRLVEILKHLDRQVLDFTTPEMKGE